MNYILTKAVYLLALILSISCLMALVLNSISRKRWETRKFFHSDSPEFEDEYFLPLMAAFRSAANLSSPSTPRLSFRSGKVPRFLVWGEPFMNAFWSAQVGHVAEGLCPLPCTFTFNVSEMRSVDAVVVHMRGIPSRDLLLKKLSPRDPTQPWILSTFEAPPRANSIHHTDYRTLDGIFNRTMLYRRDADVVVPHGFIVRRDEAKLLPKSWHVPPLQHPGSFHTRDMIVTFISNCNAQSGRLEYIRELQKHIPVDIYGACGEWKCGHSLYVEHRYDPTKDSCFKDAGGRYFFYLAFENSLCTDYVTEKLYNLMYYPIVPIVLGAANYSAAMPPNSYIDARQYTPRELAAKLKVLAKNPQEYQKYLSWRQYYQPSTIGGQPSLCHLCVRLHDPEFYKHQVIEDFYEWFVVKSEPADGRGLCI